MRAGDLRWKATIYSPPTGRTSSGAPTSLWVTVGTRRVKVEEITGSKDEEGDQPKATAYYRVTMRRYAGFSTAWRMVIQGAPFDGLTLAVANLRQDLTETVVTCVRKGAASA